MSKRQQDITDEQFKKLLREISKRFAIAGGVVILSHPITAARTTLLPCETVTRPEAVTLIVAATPTCLAVVRAVLTVLIRHGPSFTLALPPVALVLSFT